MVRTYGLTHINLVVRDVERSLRFYGKFSVWRNTGRTEGLVHTRTPGLPGCHQFDEHSSGAVSHDGIAHFGFRLVSPEDIECYHAATRIEMPTAGASLIPNLDLVAIGVGDVGVGAARTEFAPLEQLATGALDFVNSRVDVLG